MDNAASDSSPIAEIAPPLSPQRVRELSELAPSRAISDALSCWTLILAAWAFCVVCPFWWAYLLAVPVIGARVYALLIIGHDGFHGRVMNSRRSNNFAVDLLIHAPVGLITRLNSFNHMQHHDHVYTPQDPDAFKYDPQYKQSIRQVLAYCLGVSSLRTLLRNVLLRRGETGPARGRYAPHEILLLVAWQGALFAGLTYAIGWWAYVALWWLPVYLFAYCADSIRSFAEHAPLDAGCTQTRFIVYHANRLERFFFAPMNMNYHATHHCWPSIPYYNLPQAEFEAFAAQPGVWERRTSYLGFLATYLRSLQRVRQTA